MYDRMMFRFALAALKKIARMMAIIRESVQVPDCQASMVVLLSEKMTTSWLAHRSPQVCTAAQTAKSSRTLMWQRGEGVQGSGHVAEI